MVTRISNNLTSMPPDRGLSDKQQSGVKGKKNPVDLSVHSKCGWLTETAAADHRESTQALRI
jgi:hypothetical protein